MNSKDCQVLIRTSTTEREAWRTQAKKEGISLSELARIALNQRAAGELPGVLPAYPPPTVDFIDVASVIRSQRTTESTTLSAARKALDPALLAKLGVKTLAQVEAGATAKPEMYIRDVYQPEMYIRDVYQTPIDCPVEDVPTVSWSERLTSAQRKLENEQDYETRAELLRGIRVPAAWCSWSMSKRISWLDERHPILPPVEF